MTMQWTEVARRIDRWLDSAEAEPRLDAGQRASLAWIAQRIGQHGVVLADEVGTGKTRIACALVHAVVEAGGRAAVVVPHGLMHQWRTESGALGEGRPAPRELTTLTAFFDADDADATWAERSPDPDRPEWWLISHGFQVPRVGTNAKEWRVALPELVKAHLASKDERGDRRTRSGKLLAQLAERTSSRWKGMGAIARAIAPRVRGQTALRSRIEALPPLDLIDDDSQALKAAFTGHGEGRQISEILLGHWLGAFDLIVIDEAHKSRGHVDEDGNATAGATATVLARLVDHILRASPDGRRLCMTATPMELALEQWLDLLARARCGLDEATGHRVVHDLHEAAQHAAVAPDEEARLDRLCHASRAFTKVLARYVTRRRRLDDPTIRRFAAAAPASDGRPHPHRRIEPVRIPWAPAGSTADAPWFDVLFAAECMSQSARGLPLATTKAWPRSVRDAYTKLAQGHVSVDLLEPGAELPLPASGEVAEHTHGKLARTAYWYAQLEGARRRIAEEARGGLDPDTEHPRILAAVQEIERWTEQGEKVLAFGVFRHPLRLLTRVLGVRHALRMADAGRPLAHAVHDDRELNGLLGRQLERLRAERMLTRGLATGGLGDARRVLAECNRAYRNLRDIVRTTTTSTLHDWQADRRLLAGVALSSDLRDAILDHLATFVIDDFLAEGSEADLHGAERRERIEALSAQFRDERLLPLLEDADDETDTDARLEAREQALRAALLDTPGRQSEHARLLHGETDWASRVNLQAAFNRPNASPRVLVAQSQVGREGLNLHEACRVVVQFHAEWNPAILEQQIGRVDRKRSLWEQRAERWLQDGCRGEPPRIEVRQLVFEGTYDAFKWDRVRRRQRVFDASLFGSLLDAAAWERVPAHRRRDLVEAAPSFNPDPRAPSASVESASVSVPVTTQAVDQPAGTRAEEPA
jgi:superfamily II DNA or RNA helicase